MKSILMLTAFLGMSLTAITQKPAHEDSLAVVEVLNDYIDAIYKTDSVLVEKIADSTLQKSGYFYSPRKEAWSYHSMNYSELQHTASTYNAKKWIPKNAPHEVTVFEIKERTACAKISAIWGFDYVLLSKNDDGRWLMDKVLWQSYSPEEFARLRQSMNR